MASFFRGGSIRDNLAHALAMSYGMSGAVEVADDLLAQTGISDEITRLHAENKRLREALERITNTQPMYGGVPSYFMRIAREALEATDG